MAINIKFDLLNNPEPPTLILANRNGNKLGQLEANPKSIELIEKLNEASEISFTVNKYLNGQIVNLWDKLVDFKLVYCKEWNVWFECRVELDEATESVKTVFCTQLGQAELSQIMLYDIEINTEEDIARDDYKIGILYDPLDSQSILKRLLDKAPHYSILKVDDTLANIQRSFSFDSISIYDAFQEIAEEIGCLFIFHSDSDENGMPRRLISVKDLQQNCNNKDCKYRGEFTDKCPKCGSTDIEYGYGEDTKILVSNIELASNGIQLVTDTDSVKNCFKLEAGDDLMTATIRNRNPNGTDYIWYFSDATKEDMPDELVEKLDSYDEKYKHYYNTYESELDEILLNGDDDKGIVGYNDLVDKYLVYNDELEKINNPIKGFSSLMNAYYNTIDLGWYLKSGLMPKVDGVGETDAEDQGFLLETSLPPLIGVASSNYSPATADSSVLMMAKAIVSSRYKVTIKQNSSSLSGNTWSGQFVITNYSNEEDTYTTGTISRNLTDWDETYIQQKIDKMLSKENTDDLSITGLFAKDGNDFSAELKKYALVPLISFHNACQACLDILIEQGIGKKDAEGYLVEMDDEGYFSAEIGNIYEKLYIPYFNKLKAIEAEIAIRENEVNIVLGTYDVNGNLLVEGLQTNIEDIKVQIQNELNFEKYLGEDLWMQFCAYRREDKYRNENYISDGLNNAELFQRALEFYEVAENEIFKSSELQHSITATLNNLLAIPKFKSLVESFEVGNWIRVQIDDSIYKLRLVEYEISYDDFDNISVRFSDVAKTKNGYSDLEDILSDASSMASSYDSIKRQANLGNEARDMIRQWLNEGLDASLVQIQNNTNEDIVIDNNGLIGRSYSDITEEYSPEQIRLTHNIIAFTDDNWKTVKQAIGKHKYKYYDEGEKDFVDTIGYGMNADFCVAGVVAGSQIIGGDIYSDNYSITNATGSYLNLRDGTFSFGGGALQFNNGKLIISSKSADTNITEINEEWLKTTSVVAKNLQVDAANVSGKLIANKIDASEIKVKAAQIDDTLTIGQLPSSVIEKGDNISELNNDSGYQDYQGVVEIADGCITADKIMLLDLEVGTHIKMGSNATISWDNVTSQPTIPTHTSQLTNNSGYQNASQVTQITKDTIQTTNVLAENLQVKAANIDGELTATVANIGDWYIASDEDSGSLKSTNGSYTAWMHTPGYNSSGYANFVYAILEGNKNIFFANTDGKLFARKEILTYGEIKAGYEIDNYTYVATATISGATGDISLDGAVYADGDIWAADVVTSGSVYVGNGTPDCGVYATGSITAGGDLVVDGTKSRLATTENYGQRLLYCYEAPSPMFGDIGEGRLDEFGKCYVFLDDIFAETIDTDCTYQVFLQPYGKGECYVIERTSSYFVVEGTENLSFGWEIKAIQKDFDTIRLEEFDVESEKI